MEHGVGQTAKLMHPCSRIIQRLPSAGVVVLSDLGDGVEQDDIYSRYNYELAVEQGHADARFGMTGDGSQNYRGN